MNKYILLIVSCLVMTSCSLIPKRVEYFQDKVDKVPEATATHVEARREAAAFVAKKTREVVTAAVHENSSSNVINPAIDSALVSSSLSGSLGKPLNPWEQAGQNLALKLDTLDAKLDRKLAEFKEDNDKNAGKKIEGTGLFQMSYVSHLLLVVVLFAVLWFALKLVGVATGGPVVGVGMKVVEGGAKDVAKLVSKGFSEVISGGEKFKDAVDKKIADPELKKQILEMFENSHMRAQSTDVQELVKKLTSK